MKEKPCSTIKTFLTTISILSRPWPGGRKIGSLVWNSLQSILTNSCVLSSQKENTISRFLVYSCDTLAPWARDYNGAVRKGVFKAAISKTNKVVVDNNKNKDKDSPCVS